MMKSNWLRGITCGKIVGDCVGTELRMMRPGIMRSFLYVLRERGKDFLGYL